MHRLMSLLYLSGYSATLIPFQICMLPRSDTCLVCEKSKHTAHRGNSYELYGRLDTQLNAIVKPVSIVKQLTNLIWLVVAVLQSRSIALSQLATYVPREAKAESWITHILRYLINPQVGMSLSPGQSREHALGDLDKFTGVYVIVRH
jgi:hypothetical protein